jgi:TonB family protein
MNSFLGLENIPETTELRSRGDVHSTPRLLLDLEPWGRTFWRNLGDTLLRRQPPAIRITSPPAPFWHDVFVPQRLPWGAFVESVLYHLIVFAVAWGISTLLPPERRVVQVRRFDPRDAIYYSPSEFLPPIDTGRPHLAKTIKGEPEFARQSILSVLPESDNRHQTIVTPPDIKINHDIDIPNIVAWGDHSVPVPGAALERKSPSAPVLPNQIVAPAPQLDPQSARSLASLEQRIVAPPPEVQHGARAVASLAVDVVAPSPDANAAGSRRALRGPEAAVVEPPPATDSTSIRKLGDLNIGRSEVIVPAPQLPVASQRALSGLGTDGRAVVPPPPTMEGTIGGKATSAARSGRVPGTAGGSDGQVIPPPPSVPGPRSADAGGRIIALGIHPSVAPPPEPPQGNRRGTFAASPQGKGGAPGTPDLRADSSGTDGFGAGKNGASSGTGSGRSAAGAPPGLHVGPGTKSATAATAGGDPAGNGQSAKGETPGHTEIAKADVPHTRTSSTPHPKADLVENPTPLERQIFRDRRLYSMTMNMPNLNSAGGSWIMRFAEIGDVHEKGELIAPVAEHKVDPAYPLQLMRENVSGTVTLRAIIRADGSVTDIHVVNGADSRLDHYASEALARWHFLPAMKNDANVDVEAIVMIPFRPILKRSQF